MQCKIRKIYNLEKHVRARSRKPKLKNKLQFIAMLENAVGNAVLSVPKEFWGSMPQNSYDFHDLQYKYMPLRGRNAEDSVPYGMLDKLQFDISHTYCNTPCLFRQGVFYTLHFALCTVHSPSSSKLREKAGRQFCKNHCNSGRSIATMAS